MPQKLKLFSMLVVVFGISACTSIPAGPGMLVLPGTGKSFNQFRFDEDDCRQYASAQVGGRTANQAATDSGVKSAVVGTVVGVTAGALLGGNSGAGIGAGSGLLIGSAIGAGTGDSSGYNLQQRYDFAYVQCMYAKGHRVPVSGNLEDSRQPVIKNTAAVRAPSATPSLPPASSSVPPPPPRGNPPPPPSGVSTAP
ncbi:MAG: Glycine-zipper containing OmpA-like membrane domain-containing protein [Candidatus Nitrotoga sp. CP45]|nr:MAG: Glycine-zipper containing OmpA-like membrane domain-containing protein [Candidatus Nitrotoga sp. CP45]